MARIPLDENGKGSIFVLYSIHNVMKAEKILKGRQVTFDTVPVPKEISSDCGMAILTASAEAGSVKQVLLKSGIAIKGIYLKTTSGYEETNDG